MVIHHGHTIANHGQTWSAMIRKAMLPWSILCRRKYGENGIKIEVITAWCWVNGSESLCRKKKPTNTLKTYLPELSDPSLQNLSQAGEPFYSSLDHRPRPNKVAFIFGLQGLALEKFSSFYCCSFNLIKSDIRHFCLNATNKIRVSDSVNLLSSVYTHNLHFLEQSKIPRKTWIGSRLSFMYLNMYKKWLFKDFNICYVLPFRK